MPDNDNNLASYLDSISSAGIAAAAQESRRMAQKIEDERVREAQDALRKRDMKAREEAQKKAEKEAAEKRAKLEAETDAIIQAQNEAEKERAKREWRGAVGSMEGFEKWWAESAADRATAKMRERNANVVTGRQVWTGDIGPRAHFTPVRFPN